MSDEFCMDCGKELAMKGYEKLINELADERDAAWRALEVLRAERRWIPVEERMPEENVQVLCIDSQNVQMIACFGWGEWWHPDIDAPITHWMPLPELPKEVQG